MRKIKDKQKHLRLSLTKARKRIKRKAIKALREKRARKRLSGYKEADVKRYLNQRDGVWVFAPKSLTLFSSPDKTIAFVNELERLLKKETPVFISLFDVVQIDYGALSALLAVMFRFKEVGIKFNGNFPRNNDAARVFIESGFLYRLFDNDSRKTIYKINEKHQFVTQDEDGKFDQKLINNHIVPEVTSFIWGAERRCPGLYPILLELIDNTKAHASEIQNGTERWWLSINHDQQNKKVSFVFLDYGIGIFTSLERKSDDNFHKKMITQVQKIVGTDAHEKYLEKIVDVGGKSSTGLKNRGLGIRGIKLASDRNQINNLIILSNHALGNVSSGQYIRTRNDFNGTLYFWELCYNNENLDNL